MFRNIEEKDIPIISDLWKEIFLDQDAYIEHYFKYKYKQSYSFVIEENDKIISSLQVHPYHYRLMGVSLSLAYFYAVFTIPEQREQGYMHSLMQSSLRELYNKDITLACLVPATASLFSLYKRYSFATTFFLWEKYYGMQPTANEITLYLYHSNDFDSVFTYYDAFQKQLPNGIYKCKQDFKIAVEEHLLDHGCIYYSKHGDTICGIVFITEAKEVKVREMFTSKVYYNAILNTLLKQYSLSKLLVQSALPTMKSNQRPTGMTRVINAYKVLNLLASKHPDLNLEISIKDNDIYQNEGVFLLHQGTCEKISNTTKENAITMEEFSRYMLLGGDFQGIKVLSSIPYLGHLMD